MQELSQSHGVVASIEILARHRSTSGICRRGPTTTTCANSSNPTVIALNLKKIRHYSLFDSPAPTDCAVLHADWLCESVFSPLQPRQPSSATFCHLLPSSAPVNRLRPSSTIFSHRHLPLSVKHLQPPSGYPSTIFSQRQPRQFSSAFVRSRPIARTCHPCPMQFHAKLSPLPPGNA